MLTLVWKIFWPESSWFSLIFQWWKNFDLQKRVLIAVVRDAIGTKPGTESSSNRIPGPASKVGETREACCPWLFGKQIMKKWTLS